MKNKRAKWLLFPVVSGVLLFAITMVGFFGKYPNKDFNYWFGYWFGFSIFAIIPLMLISLICVVIGYAPRVKIIAMISFVVCCGIQFVWIISDYTRYNGIIFISGLIIVPVTVIGFYYFRVYRIIHNQQLPFQRLYALFDKLGLKSKYPGTYSSLENSLLAFLMTLVPISLIPDFLFLSMIDTQNQSTLHLSKIISMLFLSLSIAFAMFYFFRFRFGQREEQFNRTLFNWFCIIEYIFLSNAIYFLIDPYSIFGWKTNEVVLPVFYSGLVSSSIILLFGIIDDIIVYLRKDIATS